MSNIHRVLWTITAANPPRPLLHCRRCDAERAFESSGKFRLNANGKRLDAWLVYRCAACGNSWNREIFERRSRAGIARSLLDGLQANDADLARRIAFDASGLGRLEAAGGMGIAKRLLAPSPSRVERLAIGIAASGPVDRADRLLARGLGLPRGEIGALASSGRLAIVGAGGRALARPLRNGAVIEIDLTGRQDAEAIALRAGQ